MTEPGRNSKEIPADPSDEEKAGLAASVGRLVQRVMKLKPVRVFFQYLANGGPLMASGLAYALLFAVFAGLVVGFAVIGFVVRGDIGLRDSIVDSLANAVPGLIDNGSNGGAIDPRDLLDSGALAGLGIIALIGLLFTALNFLASARDAVRRIFSIAPPTTFFLLLKLKDLGLAVLFGVALIVSTVLSTASTAALGFVLDLIGVGAGSVTGTVLVRMIGLALVLALDTAVLVALYRVLAGIPIPRRPLLGGALIGGVALGALKVLGNTLLGGASSNPLLASFAVIIGLLIFFNLVCQVILIAASWIAVGMEDAGVAADPVAAEAARVERERIDELERIAAQARKPLVPRVLGAIFRRRAPERAGSAGADSAGAGSAGVGTRGASADKSVGGSK